MKSGTVTVDRTELARALAASGLDPDVAMKSRITINAIVRRACTKCGLPQITAPGASETCSCIGGPFGAVENLGVVSDSGPRRFLARQWWKVTQAFKRPQPTRPA